jgi:hypothetical protein
VLTLRSNHSLWGSVLIATLTLYCAVVPHGLWAQDQHSFRGVTVMAGPANYDLSGTGWSWLAAARLELPLGRMLILEPSLGFFTYHSQFASRYWYLLPEISLQIQYPGPRLRPYLGVGAGGAFVLEGIGATEPTVHAAAGLRLAISPAWGLRGEGRARNITVFEANNSILEFVVGFSRRW